MSAQRDPEALVYLCPLCGPCLGLVQAGFNGESVTLVMHHSDVDHPDWFTFDDEGLPS